MSGTSLRSLLESLVLAQSPKFSALHTRHRSHLPIFFHRHSIAFSLSSLSLHRILSHHPLFVFIHTSLCVFLFHDTIFRQIPTMLMRILFYYMLYFLSFGRYLWFSSSRHRLVSRRLSFYHISFVYQYLSSQHYLTHRTKGFAGVSCSPKIPFSLF